MLSPYRVLDLTAGDAAIGPMILADLGADVIKVEPPEGADQRRQRPYAPAAPESLGSLRFHAYDRNKRSAVCDLASDAGRSAFLELVRGADFLFEDAGPGAMAARGLGYEALRAVNPGLVYVAVSPFGQDGPYAHHLATDLTLGAMGGVLAVNGDADRAPLRLSSRQAWLHGGAESAIAAMVAHFRRLQTGEGQFVDVSVQAALFWTGLNAMIASAIHRNIERAGTLLQLGVIDMPLVYPTLDGEVVLILNSSTMVGSLPLMVADGIVPESWLTAEDWPNYDVVFLTGGKLTVQPLEAVEVMRRWTATKTKQDLYQWGLGVGVTMAPVSTVADVLVLEHLRAREYWMPYELPGGPTVDYPGPFVRLEKTPLNVRRPAPALGEHTAEVLGEPRTPAPVAAAGEPDSLPFDGLKIADFSWIAVGPITAKYFADHGAATVRVETVNPPDRLRGAGPHKDGIPGPNRSQFFASFNTSKQGIILDLKQPGGLAVAKKLIAWCDLAFESFTPGTMKRFGLDYSVAKELNPGIIMVSTCLMGQTGPAAGLAGYGYHAAAISGFYEITGWPDRSPGGPFNAYTDVIAPRFLSTTVAAALDHRRRTGEGQYIEQAQIESALHFLATELADCQVNGVVARRAGNDDPEAAPHNAYPTAGDDQWIAIAIATDAQWQALRRAMGDPAWAADPALDTLEGRLERRREIDERIGGWTRDQERYALMEALQAAGVPAGVVQRSSDHLQDPQLAHRHFFRRMVHGEMGEIPYEGHQFRIAGYDSGPRSPSPLIGEHTFEVLTDVLGIEPEEAAELIAMGGVGA